VVRLLVVIRVLVAVLHLLQAILAWVALHLMMVVCHRLLRVAVIQVAARRCRLQSRHRLLQAVVILHPRSQWVYNRL
jgi:hypothetical protein